MTEVSINKEILDDLVDFKLGHIVQEIRRILEQWNYRSVDLFLEHARDGTLRDAEMDAIALRQLELQRDKLEKIRMSGTGD